MKDFLTQDKAEGIGVEGTVLNAGILHCGTWYL